MKTSTAGIAAIRQREGCKLNAYKDSVGVVTIGVGHTGRASPPTPAMGDKISQAQADAYLASDLAPFEAAVNTSITRAMSQGQFDACVSLAFNIGEGGFKGSTLVRKFNAGDVAGAADAILLWSKQEELRSRRVAERAQFLAAGNATVAPAKTTKGVSKPKAAAAAITVAAGAGAAVVPHSSTTMGVLIGTALVAAAAWLSIHFKK